jgi:hypothetical protein
MHICPMEMQIKLVSSCLCSRSELHFMAKSIIFAAMLIKYLLLISNYFSAFGWTKLLLLHISASLVDRWILSNCALHSTYRLMNVKHIVLEKICSLFLGALHSTYRLMNVKHIVLEKICSLFLGALHSTYHLINVKHIVLE